MQNETCLQSEIKQVEEIEIDRIHVEKLTPEGSQISGQMIIFTDQQLPRCSKGSAVPGPRSPDIDRNSHPSLTDYDTLTLLSHRQYVWRLEMDYNKIPRKLICTTQRRMLCVIVQTEKRHFFFKNKDLGGKDI